MAEKYPRPPVQSGRDTAIARMFADVASKQPQYSIPPSSDEVVQLPFDVGSGSSAYYGLYKPSGFGSDSVVRSEIENQGLDKDSVDIMLGKIGAPAPAEPRSIGTLLHEKMHKSQYELGLGGRDIQRMAKLAGMTDSQLDKLDASELFARLFEASSGVTTPGDSNRYFESRGLPVPSEMLKDPAVLNAMMTYQSVFERARTGQVPRSETHLPPLDQLVDVDYLKRIPAFGRLLDSELMQ